MTGVKSIRTRLTVAVTGVFAVAAILGAWVIYHRVADQLYDNARINSMALLDNYLTGATGGGPVIASVSPGDPGSFFYMDAAGNELTPEEYFEALMTIVPSDALVEEEGSSLSVEGESIPADAPPPSADPEERQIFFSGNIESQRVAPIRVIERGEDVIAVAQPVSFDDVASPETVFQIGVVTPLAPIEDGLSAIRWVLWVAVPVLIAIVALLTYMTANRALRPVHSITRRTRSITDANLSERVPVPDSGDDISELATTMNEMLDRLDGSQQRQRRFIADASHELRSPVAASKAQLEVALAHPENTDWPAAARRMLGEHEHLSQFIDDLLALSRMDEIGLGTVTEVDVEDLIMGETINPEGTKITTEIEGEVKIEGNRLRLRRALRNLIDNATRHAEERVSIEARTDGDTCVIHVDDDGPGVPEEQREVIFDRFTRLDDARGRDEGGTGLGLAIVRRIVELHDGDIRCADSPSGGARFTMRLPLTHP